MSDSSLFRDSLLTESFPFLARPTIGRIVHLSADGRPAVDFPGNDWGPLEARTICEPPDGLRLEQLEQVDVLLLFEDDDRRVPLIAGFPRNRFTRTDSVPAPQPKMTEDPKPAAPAADTVVDEPASRMTVHVDGRRVAIDAEKEIQLRCGRSSITLRQDGKIVIKGTHIVSRADGPHRIKGGSVTIN